MDIIRKLNSDEGKVKGKDASRALGEEGGKGRGVGFVSIYGGERKGGGGRNSIKIWVLKKKRHRRWSLRQKEREKGEAVNPPPTNGKRRSDCRQSYPSPRQTYLQDLPIKEGKKKVDIMPARKRSPFSTAGQNLQKRRVMLIGKGGKKKGRGTSNRDLREGGRREKKGKAGMRSFCSGRGGRQLHHAQLS